MQANKIDLCSFTLVDYASSFEQRKVLDGHSDSLFTPPYHLLALLRWRPVRIRSNPLRAQQGNDGSFSWHHVLLTYITTHSFRSSSVPSPSGRAHTITGIHAQDLNPSPLYRACRGTVQGFGTVPRLWTAGRINPGFSIHSPSSTACRSQH